MHIFLPSWHHLYIQWALVVPSLYSVRCRISAFKTVLRLSISLNSTQEDMTEIINMWNCSKNVLLRIERNQMFITEATSPSYQMDMFPSRAYCQCGSAPPETQHPCRIRCTVELKNLKNPRRDVANLLVSSILLWDWHSKPTMNQRKIRVVVNWW